jgi:cytochrome c biogenesis protein CcdA
MVGTILPVVYGQRASGRLPVGHWLHLVSSVVGAAVLGYAIGAVGGVFRPDPALAAAVTLIVACAYLAASLGLVQIPTPQRRQQVPIAWRAQFGPAVMSVGYGLALGAGVFTHVWVYSFYPVLVWIALAGGPWAGLVVWSAFGLGRALPVVIIGARTRDIREAFQTTQGLEAWSSVVYILDGLLLALTAGYLLGVLGFLGVAS